MRDLRFEHGRLVLMFADGRELAVPLQLYPSLKRATPAQRADWHVIGPGKGLRWESLDLDLALEGVMAGVPEGVPKPPPLDAEVFGADIAGLRPADRAVMSTWVHEALRELGGSGSVAEVAKLVWERHEADIRRSGELLYKWQYEIRWAADMLRRKGVIQSTSPEARGVWKLSG